MNETFQPTGTDPDDMAIMLSASLLRAGRQPHIRFRLDEDGNVTDIEVHEANHHVFARFPCAPMSSGNLAPLESAMNAQAGAWSRWGQPARVASENEYLRDKLQDAWRGLADCDDLLESCEHDHEVVRDCPIHTARAVVDGVRRDIAFALRRVGIEVKEGAMPENLGPGKEGG